MTRRALSAVAAVAALLVLAPAAVAGDSQKFKLFGTAMDDVDPQNGANEVVSFDTNDPNAIAGIARKLGDHRVQVPELDNHLEVKYLLVGRTCGGGSPRFQLFIDPDGAGPMDPHNAFGYLGDMPFGGGCAMGNWTFEDMTNASAKWDLSQFGGSFTNTWDQVEAFFSAFPNHQVLQGSLVDDSGSFFPGDRGCAYFDLVSIGNRTLTGNSDTDDGAKTSSC